MEISSFFILLIAMKMLLFFLGLNFTFFGASSQVWETAPLHKVKENGYACGFSTPAHIDSSLFARTLNSLLLLDHAQFDSVPEGIYKIPVMYIVDTAGRISSVKSYENPFGLGDFTQKNMSLFPYKWSPATQNGRPVKSYYRIIIVYDLRKNKISPA